MEVSRGVLEVFIRDGDLACPAVPDGIQAPQDKGLGAGHVTIAKGNQRRIVEKVERFRSALQA
jgi:hypothetical protein